MEIVNNMDRIAARFDEAVSWDGTTLTIDRWAHPLVRLYYLCEAQLALVSSSKVVEHLIHYPCLDVYKG